MIITENKKPKLNSEKQAFLSIVRIHAQRGGDFCEYSTKAQYLVFTGLFFVLELPDLSSKEQLKVN